MKVILELETARNDLSAVVALAETMEQIGRMARQHVQFLTTKSEQSTSREGLLVDLSLRVEGGPGGPR
jgi:hypothetical protein